MYKIGELSKLSKIPVKTLRYYDSEGILVPDEIDEFTGYRYYSAAKLSDCYRILALKELGFTLDEIRTQFSMPRERMAGLIATKEQELRELMLRTEHRINILRELQSALKEDVLMFDIVIRKSDEIRVAYERRVISDKSECEHLLSEIRSQLPEGIIGDRTVVADYETEFRSDSFDTGFGIEITGRLPKDCRLSEKTIRFSDETASLICAASEYDKAVVALNRHAHDNNYQVVGALYKITYADGTVEVKLPVVKLGEFDPDRNEDVKLTFENDEQAIGRWELLDYLPCREMFHPEKRKSAITNKRVKELYFLPEGEWYWCFGWTKGYVLTVSGYPKMKSVNPYTIEEINGEEYMFVEMRFDQYFRGGKPELWVFKRMDARAHTKWDIMIKDEIPDVPADDRSVLGCWEVCDLLRSPEDFVPGQPNQRFPMEALFWRSAEFLEGGEMRNRFKNAEDGSVYTDKPGLWRWVTGNVIGIPRSTVSKYLIKKFGDAEYIFIQWKSGDYSYGGDEPYWYVFKKS